ncbi:hypothetical protein [Actinomadura fibrosa]|uniref:CHAD domain-containing protein n=1 Tax=Actinomadura fibrosa TaxID=111802 RepID=A0ABW2XNJ8_9ACTN|nr:hypothetical protein [Actinomadura fibrosa]
MTTPPPDPAAALTQSDHLLTYLDRILVRVRNLDRDLDRILARARDLDRDLVRSHVVDFDLDLDLVSDLVRDFVRALDLDHALHRDLDRAFKLNRGLSRALVRSLARVRFRVLVRDLDRALSLDLDLDLVHVCLGKLTRAVAQARERLAEVQEALPSVTNAAVGRSGKRAGALLASTAVRAAGWAVRMLPSADRPRYAEEFRSELWELAAADAGRWRQVRHAVRLLVRAPLLRRELTRPRARRALS